MLLGSSVTDRLLYSTSAKLKQTLGGFFWERKMAVYLYCARPFNNTNFHIFNWP